MVQKIVINTQYGGFDLSEEALKLYNEKSKQQLDCAYFLTRDDPILLQVQEECPSKNLKIVEIPDGVKWQIEEYDGVEWISEIHRTWR